MSTNTNGNRRNRAASSKPAQADAETVTTDAPEQTAAPDAQVAAPVAEQASDAPVMEAGAAPAGDDAPASEPEQDAPGQEVTAPEQDAPATQADAPAEPDAPADDAPAGDSEGDAPAGDSEADAGAAAQAARRDPTWADYIAAATSGNAEVSLDARLAHFAQACRMAGRDLLTAVAALPDDAPLNVDRYLYRPDSARGRGVAAAKATLALAQALFGGGWYVGSTHDSTQRDPIRVYVIIPEMFKPVFDVLVEGLHHANGPLVQTEKSHDAALRANRKATGNYGPQFRTEYAALNKDSRIAMLRSAERITDAIKSAFPADDEQIAQIRMIVDRCAVMLVTQGITKNLAMPQVERYAPPFAPAQELVMAEPIPLEVVSL